MSSLNDNNAPVMTIITTDATTFHTEGEPIIHIKHFFDIEVLKGLGLDTQETLLYCGIHGYFNVPQLIYSELVRMSWRSARFKD